MLKYITWLAAAAITIASPARAQSAQDRFWDGAIAGDTTGMARALAEGAAIDSLDTRTATNGRRALNWAALGGHVDAIRFLSKRGAKVNLANLTGFTPLHHAAEAGQRAAAAALLDAGADKRILNRAGISAGEVAVARGHDDVAALLGN